LLTLGFVGGMVPSPSAVLLLFGASGAGRPLLGVLLVLAYGGGMAAALIATGIALAYGHRRLLDRLARRATTVHQTLPRLAATLPLLTALVIVVVGAVLSGRGLAQLIA
jgi:ABC-type nickel/cobalt efflux system permease component RcnA